MNNEMNMLKIYIERDNNILNHVDDYGNNLLHYACRHSSFDIMHVIIDNVNHYDVWKKNNYGLVPFDYACMSHDMKKIKYFIDDWIGTIHFDQIKKAICILCELKNYDGLIYLVEKYNNDIQFNNNFILLCIDYLLDVKSFEYNCCNYTIDNIRPRIRNDYGSDDLFLCSLKRNTNKTCVGKILNTMMSHLDGHTFNIDHRIEIFYKTLYYIGGIYCENDILDENKFIIDIILENIDIEELIYSIPFVKKMFLDQTYFYLIDRMISRSMIQNIYEVIMKEEMAITLMNVNIFYYLIENVSLEFISYILKNKEMISNMCNMNNIKKQSICNYIKKRSKTINGDRMHMIIDML
jgi:hypothetical protein